MIFTSLRRVARVGVGLAATALGALLGTAIAPGLGIAIAMLFWVIAAVSSTLLLAPAGRWLLASASGPARKLLATIAALARRARRTWWVRLRIYMAGLRVWTCSGPRDHCGPALLMLASSAGAGSAPASGRGVVVDVTTSGGRRGTTRGGD